MGNTHSIKKINFEDIKFMQKNMKTGKSDADYVLLNTLPEDEQDCLIKNTIHSSNEVQIMNEYIRRCRNIRIVIYGKNSNDASLYNKFDQLQALGFTEVYVYIGGMFEWLLLQDVYGTDEFPTTKQELDILKYKPLGIVSGQTKYLTA